MVKDENKSALLSEALLETIRLAVREEVGLAFREARYGEDRLLNVEEVSKILSVPKSWLYGHASSLPFTRRLGKHLRFSFQGLQRWIDARKTS